ncbi:hypothetical protein [Chryseobacterium mucoviscidosis]|uniref:Uncharacterized protein n=1 Tax=Chryseobacterium mucoviscidosis TaxID=1945581 RepID=A0A202BP30_9FLAO|nr:hypothetical protein [Chryseobacterium mucoviscidosis]OVE53234.1 hypothetical protein B0E34_20650 [Chryseobacterium mucoviscidosis]
MAPAVRSAVENKPVPAPLKLAEIDPSATPSGMKAISITVAFTLCPDAVLFFPPKRLLKKFPILCIRLGPVFLGVESVVLLPPPPATPTSFFPRARAHFPSPELYFFERLSVQRFQK